MIAYLLLSPFVVTLGMLSIARSLALVVSVAAFLRLYRIHELPLGPYVDEIQTLRNALGPE